MISNNLLNSVSEQWNASLPKTAEVPDSKRPTDLAGCSLLEDLLEESSKIQKDHRYTANSSNHIAEAILEKNDKIEIRLGKKVFFTKSRAESALIMHGKSLIDRKTTTKYSYDGISMVHEALNKLTTCGIPAENPSSVVERYPESIPP